MSILSTILPLFAILAVVIVLFALLIWLQFSLTRHAQPWVGLILPGAGLLFALICAIGVIARIAMYPGNVGVALLEAIIVFLVANIPTIVFACIYVHARRHTRLDEELNRMSAQDL